MHKSLVLSIDAIKSEHKYCSENCPKVGDHLYSLRVPYGSPYEEVYEVLNDMIADIKKYEQDVKEQAESVQIDAVDCDQSCEQKES